MANQMPTSRTYGQQCSPHLWFSAFKSIGEAGHSHYGPILLCLTVYSVFRAFCNWDALPFRSANLKQSRRRREAKQGAREMILFRLKERKGKMGQGDNGAPSETRRHFSQFDRTGRTAGSLEGVKHCFLNGVKDGMNAVHCEEARPAEGCICKCSIIKGLKDDPRTQQFSALSILSLKKH